MFIIGSVLAWLIFLSTLSLGVVSFVIYTGQLQFYKIILFHICLKLYLFSFQRSWHFVLLLAVPTVLNSGGFRYRRVHQRLPKEEDGLWRTMECVLRRVGYVIAVIKRQWMIYQVGNEKLAIEIILPWAVN